MTFTGTGTAIVPIIVILLVLRLQLGAFSVGLQAARVTKTLLTILLYTAVALLIISIEKFAFKIFN